MKIENRVYKLITALARDGQSTEYSVTYKGPGWSRVADVTMFSDSLK